MQKKQLIISILLINFFINIFITNLNAYDFYDIKNDLDFLSNRDKIISQNIANSDTPNYIPIDILKNDTKIEDEEDIFLKKTHLAHFSTEPKNNEFKKFVKNVTEIKPNGNMVNLQDEMAEKDLNALKYNQMINFHNVMKNLSITASQKID
ncbi:flagellar basal body rod protein FlgB [Lyticum sinuosum]|uniref:Flagellar basal body rod protein FlgB n=1 Tax=Lyticum sinuosum TaxID=1332059 RepID=A0AAE5AHA4_9RICK|nr:hypothetical protein [Lyticum sinuosum]MDZ5760878.1 Flagellar basal body rod protein FlgB [Lyticum sinuosum]